MGYPLNTILSARLPARHSFSDGGDSNQGSSRIFYMEGSLVRPPGLEPGSFGYKPNALTFVLWAQERSKIRISHILIFSERRVHMINMGAYAVRAYIEAPL